MARKTQLAYDLSHPTEAIELGEAALNIAPEKTRIAATAAIHCGVAYALAGDADAAQRCFESAHQWNETPDLAFGFYLDPVYVRAHEALALDLSGHHNAAVELYGRGVAQDGYHRDSGVYAARRAVAQARAGDIERASTSGLVALAVHADTGSNRIAARLNELNALLNERGQRTGFQEAMAQQGARR